MQFKDIKQGYPVYILDKSNLNFSQGKTTAVSFSRMDVNQKTGKAEMVRDITIEADDKTATYTIPEELSVTYAGNLVLSTDKQGLINDVNAVQSQAEQILAQREEAETLLAKAPGLLVELNPVYKEKQETEKRFSKIEDAIAEMKDMLSGFIKEFKS